MTVTSRLGPVPVQVGDKRALPANFTARFDFDEDNRPSVELAIETEDGAPVCNEIRVLRLAGHPPLTKGELRRLPLAQLMAFACAEAELRSDAPGTHAITDGFDSDAVDSYRKTRRRNAITQSLLRHVAAVVKAHEADGAGGAVDALKAEYQVSTATVYRWIGEARKRKLLSTPRASRKRSR